MTLVGSPIDEALIRSGRAGSRPERQPVWSGIVKYRGGSSNNYIYVEVVYIH